MRILSEAQYKELLCKKEEVVTKEVTVVRFSLEQYKHLEKMLPKPTATAHDIEAGYLLGIQKVLGLLREGFVIGT